MIQMKCPCGAPMARQIMGNWLRSCDCRRRDYYATVRPMAKDAAILHSLTGRSPAPDLDGWTHYGPRCAR